MNDRELLELAANATGIDWIPATTEKGIELEPVFGLWLRIHGEPIEHQRRRWNPLTDDGDALRLAVKLEIDIEREGDSIVAWRSLPRPGWDNGQVYSWSEPVNGDPYTATRRAIVFAAAATAQE